MSATQSAARRPPAAELARVTNRFGETVALTDVSLTIRPGELVALLGANGAGKTTAVKLLLGLARPTAGSARVFGGDPTVARNRTRTGAMLQVGKVPETLRVREHIELFSQVRLTISDDGRGGTQSSGVGLTGMLERIAALGGTVVRDGSRGTTRTITLPAIASAGEPSLVRSA